MPSALPFRASDVQHRFDLEHGWQFLPDPSGKLTISELAARNNWLPVRVGLSWNAQFEDLRDYMGAAWYRVSFETPLPDHIRHVLLKFGAVDYYCEVFVNDVRIGIHEGGYTPFSFDISKAIRSGRNELAIRVIDPPMDEALNKELFPEILYNEIPHGKQNWYVQNSGIWQGVRLEFAPAVYIDRLQITPKITGEFRVEVFLEGEGLSDTSLVDGTKMQLAVSDSHGRTVWSKNVAVASSEIQTIEGLIPSPRLWGPNHAHLYTLDVALEGAIQTHRRIRFGFRELTARDGKLFLNGKPFYMIAALDQDFYPETIHTPASEEGIRDMMLKARELGINVLRCHLKVAHPVYLDVADEIGMLVWAELPSWSDCWFPCDHFSEKAAKRGEAMFAEVVVRDWNHPCVVIQTIMNESWGINLKEATQRQWLKETFDRIKSELAPLGRLVVDNSACEGNFHLKTDIEDFHNYYSQPDQADTWDKFVRDFASRAAWTFSEFGDAERTRKEPLVVSEFGNWGLPQLPPELPWWFHNAFGEREVTRPSGVLERFHKYGLDHIFADYAEIAEQTQWHQYISLKYEIESLRSHDSIQGYCVTGMTDIHWEANGLLDMWRNPKIFSEELRRLQSPDIVIPQFRTVNVWSSQSVEVNLIISHYSELDLSGARVRWSTDSGQSGSFLLERSPGLGSVERIGTISFMCNRVDELTKNSLYVEIRSKNGARICENRSEFYVFPEQPAADRRILFYDPLETSGDLEHRLTAAGYQTNRLRPNSNTADLLVATTIDDEVLDFTSQNGTALILANSEAALPDTTPFKITKRAGTWLDGRWFSNYNWINPNCDPYRSFAPNRLLAFESRAVAPDYVIENVPAHNFDDVLSGITLGWLNLNNALTVQVNIGSGKALITTYRFDAFGSDPYASHLLHAYIRYAGSTNMRARTQLEVRQAHDQRSVANYR